MCLSIFARNEQKEEVSTPWKDGIYVGASSKINYFVVSGEQCVTRRMTESLDSKPLDYMKGKITHGSFKEAHPAVCEATGDKTNNVLLDIFAGVFKVGGVLSEDKKKIIFWGVANELDSLTWMSEKDFRAFKEKHSDPADAIPHHYKVQPDNQGKLVWLSGPPGLGKSTAAQLIAKNADWVWYEGDAFLRMVNPYIPLDAAEPSLAMLKQKPLRGISQQRIDIINNGGAAFVAALKGGKFEPKDIEMTFRELCRHIKSERARLGGDWVIALAVPTREMRNAITDELGPELVFVLLGMTLEEQVKRLTKRHGSDDGAQQIMKRLESLSKMYEPAGKDEENAFNVMLTCDMSREDVANKVLKLVCEGVGKEEEKKD